MTDAGIAMPPPGVQSLVQPLTECRTSRVNGPGDPGSCGAGTRIECFGDGQGVGAALTPLDCDAGISAGPFRHHDQCETALDGENGDGCSTSFTCGRQDGESCCVQVAHCRVGAPLRRYRVCPSACVAPTFVTEGYIDGCESLAELWQIDDRAGAWIGTPCLGHFVCPGAPPQLLPATIPAVYADFYYCAGGGLQMVPVFILGN